MKVMSSTNASLISVTKTVESKCESVASTLSKPSQSSLVSQTSTDLVNNASSASVVSSRLSVEYDPSVVEPKTKGTKKSKG